MTKTTLLKKMYNNLLILFAFFSIQFLSAQCIGGFQWPTSTVISDNSGLEQTISTCNYSIDEYSVISGLSIGLDYQFKIFDEETNVQGYITITDVNDVVIGHGPSPFLWTNATLSTIRVHYSDNASCDGIDECFVSTIQLFDGATEAPGCSEVVYPANEAVNIPIGVNNFEWTVPTTGGIAASYQMYYGLTPDNVDIFVDTFSEPTAEINLDGFGITFYWRIVPFNSSGDAIGCETWSFTTQESPGYCLIGDLFPFNTFTLETCDGLTPNVIANNAWAGEYSNIVVEEGVSYTFLSSVATDFITIGDEDGTTPLAFGTTPLTWESTVSGTIRFYIHLNDNCETQDESRVRSVICGDLSTDTPDWANLQWPPNAEITQGGSFTTYGQVYVAGLTDVEPNIEGQAPGILAWVGISSEGENSNPETWTNWVPASWNSGHVSNNDEYEATVGNGLLPGTYYYAFRFRLNDGPFVYAGVNGFWDEEGSLSGVLTVNAPAVPDNDECSNAQVLTLGQVFETFPLTTSNLAATLSDGPTPSCGNFNFTDNGKDVWYSVVVPASGSLTIQTQGNGGLADTAIALYSGSCGSLEELECNDDFGGTLYSSISLTSLTPDEVLYVRVWGYDGTSGSFIISAFDASLSNSTFDGNSFNYYPNPVVDRLNISYKEIISNVQIFNLLGQKVMSLSPNSTESSIDMSALTTGNYLVKVISQNSSNTFKVIKK